MRAKGLMMFGETVAVINANKQCGEKRETLECETLWYMYQPSSSVVLTDVMQCTILEDHTCSHRSATKIRNGAQFYLLPAIYVKMCPRNLVYFVMDPLRLFA